MASRRKRKRPKRRPESWRILEGIEIDEKGEEFVLINPELRPKTLYTGETKSRAMPIFNENEPLGLPKGSVRAIIALTLIVTTAYLSVTTGKVPEGLIGLSGAVGIYYFKTRETTTS